MKGMTNVCWQVEEFGGAIHCERTVRQVGVYTIFIFEILGA